jgi:hypothetical protein
MLASLAATMARWLSSMWQRIDTVSLDYLGRVFSQITSYRGERFAECIGVLHSVEVLLLDSTAATSSSPRSRLL